MLEECLEEKSGEFDRLNIYTESPDCQVLTGEDSADEDGVTNSIPRNQLRASHTVSGSQKKSQEKTSKMTMMTQISTF